MAGASLLLLLDDIASVLDDLAMMTKVAAKKTAGVLGDDLALNAQQVSGVVADRELPVVWAVAKGSLINKLVLIPAALLISALAPWLITPLLMVGGAYLCFEGAEKVLHKLFPGPGRGGEEPAVPEAPGASTIPGAFGRAAVQEAGGPSHKAFEPEGPALQADGPKAAGAQASGGETGLPEADALERVLLETAGLEKDKIKGAVRTDFVLSAEIIVIAMGSVPEDSSLPVRAAVISCIGLLMTVGVYGLVACIVKLDDAGLYLMAKSQEDSLRRRLGAALVGAAPQLMRLLTVVGTAAMFLVGGSILAHGLPFAHGLFAALESLPVAWLWGLFANAALGMAAGSLLVFALRLLPRRH